MDWSRSKKWVGILIFVLLGPSAAAQVVFSFDFSSVDHGWMGSFADYPVGEEAFYELEADHRSLPTELGADSALFITGNNHSDDLFMYFAKQVGGLQSLTTYTVVFEVVFASNVPEGSVGVGGSPSDSVWIKAGATPDMPDRFADDMNWYRMTTDKGNQSQDGSEAIVLSTFGKPEDGTTDYVLLTATNEGTVEFTATTDSSGSLWFILGTDSGFEATTSIYYTRFEATLTNGAAGPGCAAGAVAPPSGNLGSWIPMGLALALLAGRRKISRSRRLDISLGPHGVSRTY